MVCPLKDSLTKSRGVWQGSANDKRIKPPLVVSLSNHSGAEIKTFNLKVEPFDKLRANEVRNEC